MENKHFVYAMGFGTYDADGYPIRKFGISSTATFRNRIKSYASLSPIKPILYGAIPCENKQEAITVERAVLLRFSEDAYPDVTNRELRRASQPVLNFIETEMIDGETFLKTYPLPIIVPKKLGRPPLSIEERDARQKPRKRKLTPAERRARDRAYHRNYYLKTRAAKRKNKKGGNSPGQLSFLP